MYREETPFCATPLGVSSAEEVSLLEQLPSGLVRWQVGQSGNGVGFLQFPHYLGAQSHAVWRGSMSSYRALVGAA